MKALFCGVRKEMIPGYSRGKVASTGVIECIDIAVLDYWIKKTKNEWYCKSTPGTPLCVRGQETAESLAEKRIKLRLLRVGGLSAHDLKSFR